MPTNEPDDADLRERADDLPRTWVPLADFRGAVDRYADRQRELDDDAVRRIRMHAGEWSELDPTALDALLVSVLRGTRERRDR